VATFVLTRKGKTMIKPRQLIEAVAEGKATPSSIVKATAGLREYIDDRDAVEAILLVAQNDGKVYKALMDGKMTPDQAAKWGIDEYYKALMRDIKEDLMSVKGEVTKEIKKWIDENKASVARR
jgi:hypothetical protein